ncbi:hypothetical protein GWK08_12130 [Leptobacterium flavescens]|uniref:Uncharacterized protein n=1 Tax=Leptobacterium flavescens TaxID=472055 RepID=A0A6P0UTL6_9FLAO|nr:hypothetical protein [Leptobacterium flavescens]
MIKWPLCILGLLSALYSCQRDDICGEVDPTTPQLIIRFYDTDDPTAFKEVTSLRVLTDGIETPIINRQNTDSIAIPLRSFATSTAFTMIIDSQDDDQGMETGNSDIVTFSYTPNEVFISRGCGFIINYEELTGSRADDADNWIDTITIINSVVENENQAHVQIFH